MRVYFGVTIPRTRVCPDHCSPFDAFADAYFRECTIGEGEPYPITRVIWHASRGLAGKSKTLATLGLTMGYIDGAEITVLGGSQAQSTNVHRYMVAGMESQNLPREMALDITATKISLTNASEMRPLPASQKTVRGPHPSALLCMAGWTRVETPNGYVRIDSLSAGRTVRVSNDTLSDAWATVRAVADQGYQRTVTLELSDGTEITCTPDHRFATDRGWTEARHLTSDDMLRMRRRPLRSASEYERPVRDLLRQDEEHPAEDVFAMPRPDPGQGRSANRDVPDLLGSQAERRASRTAVPGLWGSAGYLGSEALPAVPLQAKGGQGVTLPGLPHAAQVSGQRPVPTLPSAPYVIGPRGGEVRSSQGDRQGGRAHLEIGDLRRGAARPAGQVLSAQRPVRSLGVGLRPGAGADGDRGPRGVLARPSGQRGTRPVEAGQAGSGRLPGAVLADGQDPPVVVGLRPGPLVRTWDITTDTGNFYAEGVLVHNCDEVDEMDLDIYDAALGQPMPQANSFGYQVPVLTVISSTWQNPDGTLTEIFRREAEAEPMNDQGDPYTPIYRWCYLENLEDNNPVSIIDVNTKRPIARLPKLEAEALENVTLLPEGWLTQATIDDKKRAVSAEMFRTEYDLGEPSIGNRAIDTELLDKCFDDLRPPLEAFAKHIKDWDEWRFEMPAPGAVYVCGADWAKEQDKTVISIARVDGARLSLAHLVRMNRFNYPTMVGRFNDLVTEYGVAFDGYWHDSTGLGNVVNDYLDDKARAFQMVGDKRAKLFSNFVNSIEKIKWSLPREIRILYSKLKFCRTGDLYHTEGTGTQGTKWHPPDELVSLALCWHAAGQVVRIGTPVAIAKDGTPGKMQRHFQTPSEEFTRIEGPKVPAGRQIDLAVGGGR